MAYSMSMASAKEREKLMALAKIEAMHGVSMSA